MWCLRSLLLGDAEQNFGAQTTKRSVIVTQNPPVTKTTHSLPPPPPHQNLPNLATLKPTPQNFLALRAGVCLRRGPPSGPGLRPTPPACASGAAPPAEECPDFLGSTPRPYYAQGPPPRPCGRGCGPSGDDGVRKRCIAGGSSSERGPPESWPPESPPFPCATPEAEADVELGQTRFESVHRHLSSAAELAAGHATFAAGLAWDWVRGSAAVLLWRQLRAPVVHARGPGPLSVRRRVGSGCAVLRRPL